ncbi:MAG: response regulator [Acidimicrobiia bacterium]|nr:response regulator [Acidimicrobiia bacterium]
MSWSADPELQEMFLSELDERSARLVEGAQAARNDDVDRDVAGAMMREGHTVKGTAKVMGFEAVSVAGQMIEIVWRSLHKGEMGGGIELSRALEMAARAIPDAGRGDPNAASEDLVEAVSWLKELVPGADVPDLQPSTEAEDPVEADEPVAESEPADDEDRPRPTLELVKDVPEADVEPVVEPPATDDAASAPLQAIDADAAVPVDATVPMVPVTDPSPEPMPDGYVAAARPRVRPTTRPSGALGSLVESVEGWARDHSTMVNAALLYEMMNHIAELRVEAHGLVARIDELVKGQDEDGQLARANARAVRVAAERLQIDALGLGSVPFQAIVSPLPQLVKFVSGKMQRNVRFELHADELLSADREVLDRLADAIRQLVVNSVFHGIEPPDVREAAGKDPEGVISVTAVMRERMLEVTVADDGAGVDWDLVRAIAIEENRLAADAPPEALPGVLFQAGFTTRAADGGLGGGNGLDVVATAVESLYGRAVMESTLGHGTEVKMTVPGFRSLQRLFVVDAGGVGWGFPEAAVDEVMPIAEIEVDEAGEERSIVWDGQRIPLRSLGEIVGADQWGGELHVVVLRHRFGDAAVTVNGVDGVREVAVKSLAGSVTAPQHVTGAAFMGGDDVVLVLDPGSLVAGQGAGAIIDRPAARVLVVDDSMGARAVVSGSLASSGFTTSVAGSVAEALEVLEQIEVDALVVDYAMPNADGVALVEAVRKRTDRLPIVMLSGVADESDRERAAAAGVDAFFDKADFREGALAETLWSLLQEQR